MNKSPGITFKANDVFTVLTELEIRISTKHAATFTCLFILQGKDFWVATYARNKLQPATVGEN